MTLKNSTVGAAFWQNELAENGSMRSTGNKLYSYGTVILQRLPDGKVVGNTTRYSATTSKQQSQCRVRSADILVTGGPRGTTDLIPYIDGPIQKG